MWLTRPKALEVAMYGMSSFSLWGCKPTYDESRRAKADPGFPGAHIGWTAFPGDSGDWDKANLCHCQVWKGLLKVDSLKAQWGLAWDSAVASMPAGSYAKATGWDTAKLMGLPVDEARAYLFEIDMPVDLWVEALRRAGLADAQASAWKQSLCEPTMPF